MQPYQTVTYVECHDNHTLWDRLALSARMSSEKQRKEMHKLALSIVLTSQGISFLHAGTEFLRSKKGVENSFESPDSINAIDWDLKSRNQEIHDYIRSLVKLRKEHPAFRMRTAKDITTNLQFIEKTGTGMVAFTINGAAVGDKWKKILVVYNGSPDSRSLPVPVKVWKLGLASYSAETASAYSAGEIPPYSCVIYYQ